jgi:glycosyltransferase involved in cell wall biosynthesis
MIISLVIPVWTRSREVLRECLESVATQTAADLEVVLVDDGNEQSIATYCDEFTAERAGWRVLHQANAGATRARAAGFRAARGELVGFVDCDDVIAPTYVEQLARAIAETGADASVCKFAAYRDGKVMGGAGGTGAVTTEKGRAVYKRLIDEPLLLATENRMLSSGGLALIRRTVLEKVDWRRSNWTAFEDVIWAEQVYRRVKKLALVDAALYYYRLQAEEKSVSKSSATVGPMGREYSIWRFIQYRYRLYTRRAIARGWNLRDDLAFGEVLSVAIYCWNKDKRPITEADWPYLRQMARKLKKILGRPSVQAKIATSPWPLAWFEEIVNEGFEKAYADEKF